MIYAINYDLKQPGQSYQALHKAIKGCGSWWHYLGSMWLVHTTLNAQDICHRLKPHIDTNDFFLVIRVTSDCQGWLPEEAWDWIKRYTEVDSGFWTGR